MKYCEYCGTEIDDDAKYCPNCGKACDENQVNYEPENFRDKNKTLNTVAFVFGCLTIFGIALSALVSMIFAAWIEMLSLISLAWVIPMTIRLKRAIDHQEPLSTGFKVCYLLFVNFISGILLLCRDENSYR